MKAVVSLILVLACLILVSCSEKKITKVRLESCPGCQLNRLQQVRAFVYEDFPKYDNAEFKKIQGAPPKLLFLSEDDEVVENHPLEHLSRAECNDLMKEKGFLPKDNKEL